MSASRIFERMRAMTMYERVAKVILSVGYIIGFIYVLPIVLPSLWMAAAAWLGLGALLNAVVTLGASSSHHRIFKTLFSLMTGMGAAAAGMALGAISGYVFSAVANCGISILGATLNPLVAMVIPTATLLVVVAAFALAVKMIDILIYNCSGLFSWAYDSANDVEQDERSDQEPLLHQQHSTERTMRALPAEWNAGHSTTQGRLTVMDQYDDGSYEEIPQAVVTYPNAAGAAHYSSEAYLTQPAAMASAPEYDDGNNQNRFTF
jgi:hypothetical protein